MKKNGGVTRWKVASIVLLVLLIGGGYYVTSQPEVECPTCEECEECETCPERIEDKPILNAYLSDFGYSPYDTRDLLISYWVENYGDSQADDIEVICEIYNEDDRKVHSSIHSTNLSSRSIELVEYTPVGGKNFVNNDYYWGSCRVISCSDCEILYKRIPDLIEVYEG